MKRTIVKAMCILALSVFTASCGSDDAQVLDSAAAESGDSSEVQIGAPGSGSVCPIINHPQVGHCSNDANINPNCQRLGIRQCPRGGLWF